MLLINDRSEVELAAIAHELDAAERELMASAGVDSAEFAAYVAEGSGNVAEHGMFSIQVGGAGEACSASRWMAGLLGGGGGRCGVPAGVPWCSALVP